MRKQSYPGNDSWFLVLMPMSRRNPNAGFFLTLSAGDQKNRETVVPKACFDLLEPHTLGSPYREPPVRSAEQTACTIKGHTPRNYEESVSIQVENRCILHKAVRIARIASSHAPFAEFQARAYLNY